MQKMKMKIGITVNGNWRENELIQLEKCYLQKFKKKMR